MCIAVEQLCIAELTAYVDFFQWALGSDKKVPAASKVEQDRLREAIRKKEEESKRSNGRDRGDEVKWGRDGGRHEGGGGGHEGGGGGHEGGVKS